MGYFDFLIDSNKLPKPEMEYIYLFHIGWSIDKFGENKMKYGSVVTDVVKQENDSFHFTDKESGKRYCTNYGWAFAENTPENVLNIQAYVESNKRLEELKKETYLLRDKIIDLKGESKI